MRVNNSSRSTRKKRWDPPAFLRTVRRLMVAAHQTSILHPFPRVRKQAEHRYPAFKRVYVAMSGCSSMTKNEALNAIARVRMDSGESMDVIPITRSIITSGRYDQYEALVTFDTLYESLSICDDKISCKAIDFAMGLRDKHGFTEFEHQSLLNIATDFCVWRGDDHE